MSMSNQSTPTLRESIVEIILNDSNLSIDSARLEELESLLSDRIREAEEKTAIKQELDTLTWAYAVFPDPETRKLLNNRISALQEKRKS